MSTTANDILALARSQIGVKEVPAGSNNVKYNTAYYGSEVHGAAYAWCCAFVWWLFQQAGAAALFYGGGKTAWCPAVESYAKSRGQWVTRDYQPGDCVLFDFSGKGIAGHIGVVESVRADGIICIEGNTSTTSNDNGGAVMRRTRYPRQIRGAFRPAYSAERAESEKDMSPAEVKTIIKENDPVYATENDIPDWGKSTVTKLVARKALQGSGTDAQGRVLLNIPNSMLRVLVINDRMGIYG